MATRIYDLTKVYDGTKIYVRAPAIRTLTVEEMAPWPDYTVVSATCNDITTNVRFEIDGYVTQTVTVAEAAAGVIMHADSTPPAATWGNNNTVNATPISGTIEGAVKTETIVTYPLSVGWASRDVYDYPITGFPDNQRLPSLAGGTHVWQRNSGFNASTPDGWKDQVITPGGYASMLNEATLRAYFNTGKLVTIMLWEPGQVVPLGYNELFRVDRGTVGYELSSESMNDGSDRQWRVGFEHVASPFGRWLSFRDMDPGPQSWLIRYDGSEIGWDRANMWRDENDSNLSKTTNFPFTTLHNGTNFNDGPDLTVGNPSGSSICLLMFLFGEAPPVDDLLAVSAFLRARYIE